MQELVEYCIKNDILAEFVKEHRDEVYSMMDVLFNQDYVTKVHEDNLAWHGYDLAKKEIERAEKKIQKAEDEAQKAKDEAQKDRENFVQSAPSEHLQIFLFFCNESFSRASYK